MYVNVDGTTLLCLNQLVLQYKRGVQCTEGVDFTVRWNELFILGANEWSPRVLKFRNSAWCQKKKLTPLTPGKFSCKSAKNESPRSLLLHLCSHC